MNLSLKRKITLSFILFCISYLFFLLFWLQVKNYYGRSLTLAASHITSTAKDIDFKFITEEKESISSVFFIFRKGKGGRLATTGSLDTNIYTFNTPLTFAIIITLFYFKKGRKKIFFEALSILFLLHLFYIVLFQVESISWFMVREGIEKSSLLNRALWPYLWQFFFEVVRLFEPFLVGAYVYLREDQLSLKNS